MSVYLDAIDFLEGQLNSLETYRNESFIAEYRTLPRHPRDVPMDFYPPRRLEVVLVRGLKLRYLESFSNDGVFIRIGWFGRPKGKPIRSVADLPKKPLLRRTWEAIRCEQPGQGLVP